MQTNDDLISRSAAREALVDAMRMTGYQSRLIDTIRFLPAVDAVPMVHARFGFVGPDLSVYRYDTRYGTCSACKRRIVFIPSQTNYCPNCGARMDGEENG